MTTDRPAEYLVSLVRELKPMRTVPVWADPRRDVGT